VDTVIQQCGLAEVSRKIIGHLSKGYRQRVGLADALVHEPELIILDEPTSGLDPNQIRSVRQLIKDLAKSHTVLISTHILSEVEMTCSHVVILRGGRMLAADSLENLGRQMAGKSQLIAEIEASASDLNACWEEIAEIEYVDISPAEGGYSRCSIRPRDGSDLRALVFSICKQRGWAMRELTHSRHSLEDIYMRLTRRDEEEEI
jgi:ABC-2 type transport system ATP-binding protein